MSDEMPYNLIKLILVGDTGTGKTNLISVATGNEFNSGIFTTTSCSYIQKIIKINQKEYKVNLWDTIGQEKYRSLTKIFIKDSNIVIFTYDITKRDTFTSLPYWKNVIEEILGNDITFGVVGNKIDLYLEEKVKEQEGKKYADSIGALFKLTSAKNNPKEFSDFIEILLDKYLKEHKLHPRRDTIGIKKVNEKEKKGCC
jgi:small GTP-binding protein